MKKAKEYAQEILDNCHNEDSIKKSVANVLNSMITEVQDLLRERKAQSLSALKSVVKQQEQKWKTICCRVEDKVNLNKDGFTIMLKESLPMIKDLI